ncbi:MAG: chemotaxis protein CheW [Proteobacteria bacterium]|nr:chemotaxis protein CheW [Pseudomonadota bacterium]
MTRTDNSTHSQYLTFSLGREVFALDISKVREVLEITPASGIPGTPDHLRGVINLRGDAVPVIEMRSKLGMERIDDTVDTCVIILEVTLDNETHILGALVDSVREVFEMQEQDIEPVPKMGAAINVEYINGMGRQGDQFIIIVDVDAVFSQVRMPSMAESGNASPELAA